MHYGSIKELSLEISTPQALPLLRQLLAGLSPLLRSGFDPKPIHTGYVLDNMALGETSLEVGLLCFLPLITFHQFSILIFIFILLLSEEQLRRPENYKK